MRKTSVPRSELGESKFVEGHIIGSEGSRLGESERGCLVLVEQAQYLHTLWFWLNRHSVCTPHFERKNELILFCQGRKTVSTPEFCCEPRLRALRDHEDPLRRQRLGRARVRASRPCAAATAVRRPAVDPHAGRVQDGGGDAGDVARVGASRWLGAGGHDLGANSFYFSDPRHIWRRSFAMGCTCTDKVFAPATTTHPIRAFLKSELRVSRFAPNPAGDPFQA